MPTWTSAAPSVGAGAVVLLALAAGLPAETFYTGDPGVKLLAARNALARPSQPLELPLPTVGGTRLPYLDPFFVLHDDHAHAVTPEVFPLASAPFIGLFGIRGAYILPGAGFIATLAACAWLGMLLDRHRSPPLIVATAILGTPLLFYGLEFWEHAPATAAAAIALCLMVGSAARRPVHALIPGLLFGVAVLLRPEVICLVFAALLASAWLPHPPGRTRVLALTAGALLAGAPLAMYALLHFGSLVSPHVAGNPALWNAGWLGRRVSLLSTWIATPGPSNLWMTGPALVLAALAIDTRRRGGTAFLGLTAIGTLAFVWLSAPNDGGGQWGPRYMLPAFVPISILAADVLHDVAESRRRAAAALTIVALCAAGIWVQRMSYQRLRGTKQTYGRIADFVERSTPPGGYVVTDLWWLDQVAASVAGERSFLFTPDRAAGDAVLQTLDASAAGGVTLVTSREASSDLSTWIQGTCYVAEERREIDERGLTAIPLARDCAR